MVTYYSRSAFKAFSKYTILPCSSILRRIWASIEKPYLVQCGYSVADVTTSSPLPLSGLLEGHHGLGQFGPFTSEHFSNPGRINAPSKCTSLLLHWPTLIRSLPDLINYNPHLGSFFLSFREVICARSPFFFEQLRSRYALIARNYLEDIDPYLAPCLDDNELSQLTDAANALASDTVFIGMLQDSCCESYSGLGRDTEQRSLRCRKLSMSPGMRRQCSILPHFSAAAPSIPNTSSAVFIPPAEDLLPYYTGGALTPLLTEFWIAWGLATRWDSSEDWWEFCTRIARFSGALWVSKDASDPSLGAYSDSYLIINWNKWLFYRESLGKGSAYAPLLRSRKLYPDFKATGIPINDQRQRLVLALADKYKTMDEPVVFLDPKIQDMMVNCWGPLEDNYSSAFSLPSLLKVSLGVYRTKTSTKPPKPRKKRKSRVLSVPVICTLESTDDAGVSHYFVAVHTGSKVWFIPGWDMPFSTFDDRKWVHTPLASVKKFPPGVQYLESVGSLIYSIGFILDAKRSPWTPTGNNLRAHLLDVSTYTVETLRFMLTGEVRKRSPRWTRSEDLAIIRLYRPNMTPEAKDQLSEACPTRNAIALGGRATKLRRDLISKGYYDISQLPHKSYTAIIGEEIRQAKRDVLNAKRREARKAAKKEKP